MAALAPLAVTVAAVRIADAVGLALLLLFALWGLRRGALRQVLSLTVLVGALVLAGRLGPAAEGTLAKVTSLTGEAREAAAWAAVLFAGLVVGGVLLSFLCCRMAERPHGRLDRLGGALFGGVKGAIVLTVLAYVLAAGAPGPAPSLSRGSGPATQETAEAESPWVARLRGSVSARFMAVGSDWLAGLMPLPSWIERRRSEVDDLLRADAGLARRPRTR